MKKMALCLVLFSQLANAESSDHELGIALAAMLVGSCETLREMANFQKEVKLDNGIRFTAMFAKHLATKFGYKSVADLDAKCRQLSPSLPQPPKDLGE